MEYTTENISIALIKAGYKNSIANIEILKHHLLECNDPIRIVIAKNMHDLEDEDQNR